MPHGEWCPKGRKAEDGVFPARSANLNAHAQCWVRSDKEEALSKLTPLGEGSLRKVLNEYVTHYHLEHNYQGKRNGLLVPLSSEWPLDGQLIRVRERLGGLLKYYFREAAWVL